MLFTGLTGDSLVLVGASPPELSPALSPLNSFFNGLTYISSLGDDDN